MKQIIVLSCFVLLIGCADNPVVDCDGFASEPRLDFKANSNDTLGIFFINESGNGDTVFGYGGNLFSVPIDMNSDTMYLELIGDSSLGRLIFAYTLEQKLCATSDELKQHFRTATFTPQSTYLNITTVMEGTSTTIDTSFGYASFINQTRVARHFEVAL